MSDHLLENIDGKTLHTLWVLTVEHGYNVRKNHKD